MNMINVKKLAIAISIIMVTLGSACTSTTQTQPGILTNLIDEANNTQQGFNSNLEDARPDYLQTYISANARSGLRDQVLINMQAGVEAFKRGDHHITRRLMEDAYNRIEIVYADNENAKSARSKFAKEANKDFKGEPYERAMVGYYLGLTDLLEHDLQSAKASFGWGEYQDTLSESEEFQADMNSLVFLRGWTRQCAGENASAQEDFDRVGISPNKQDNLLVLIETGYGPVKYAEGKHSEILKFKSSPKDTLLKTNIIYQDNLHELKQVEDLVYQATTRGGREIDQILEGKANFKDAAEGVADTAMNLGVASSLISSSYSQTGDYDSASTAATLGLAFSAISLISQITADQTTPAADTRQWDNLPRYINAQTLKYEGSESGQVAITSVNGTSLITPKQTGNCYLAWHRI